MSKLCFRTIVTDIFFLYRQWGNINWETTRTKIRFSVDGAANCVVNERKYWSSRLIYEALVQLLSFVINRLRSFTINYAAPSTEMYLNELFLNLYFLAALTADLDENVYCHNCLESKFWRNIYFWWSLSEIHSVMLQSVVTIKFVTYSFIMIPKDLWTHTSEYTHKYTNSNHPETKNKQFETEIYSTSLCVNLFVVKSLHNYLIWKVDVLY